MNWLARLKKQKGPDIHPTKPTEPGFVGFVGTPSGHIQKISGSAEPANDAPAGLAPARAFVPIDADRWAWPASTAMTGAEIDTFTARLARFTDMGLDQHTGERLADELVIRDREQDDRRHCLECLHLHRGDGWRCGNWQRAGIALRARDAQLSAALVFQIQQCEGFKEVQA